MIIGPGAFVLVLLGALLGASTTLIHVGTNAFAIDISPRGRRGRFFGQMQTAMHSAALVGPILVGAIAGWVGFGLAFAILAVFFTFLVPVGVMMARHRIDVHNL